MLLVRRRRKSVLKLITFKRLVTAMVVDLAKLRAKALTA
jgi:hypothetical protein